MSKRLGILTGGGDVPGLNPCIKSAVNSAIDLGFHMIGLRRGWAGPLNVNLDDPKSLDKWTLPLTRGTVRTIDRYGGTFLHTSRTNPQRIKEAYLPEFLRGSQECVQQENGLYDCTSHVLRVLAYLGIDGLIPIGGDDTLSYAARLDQEGFPTVAIPKTMDNDVFGTDYCIGFSTAVTRSVNFITDLRTPAGSHERIAVIELFGRHSGETSLIASYLAGVDRAIISEVPFDIHKLAGFLLHDKHHNPSNYAIMTISEGATMIDGEIVEEGEADAYGHRKLGGIGKVTSDMLKEITGMGTIYQQLAYLMRSGAPDSLDRMVASSYAGLALDMIARGQMGRMVALQNGNYTSVPIQTVIQGEKRVDVGALYDKKQYRPKVINVLGKPMFLY